MVGDVVQSLADPQRRGVLVAVGDDQLLTEVRSLLHNSGFVVVAEARDAPRAIESARRTQPHMCLLATDLAGGGATAAARQIASEVPSARIALLAPSVDLEQALESVQAGADAYLEHSTVNDWLVPALRAISRGETALPQVVTARVVRDWRAKRQPATGGIRRSRTQHRMRDLRDSFVEQMRYYGVLDIQPPANDAPPAHRPVAAGRALAPIGVERTEAPVPVKQAKPAGRAEQPDAPIALERADRRPFSPPRPPEPTGSEWTPGVSSPPVQTGMAPETREPDELSSVPVAKQAGKPDEREPEGTRLLYPLSWIRQFSRGLISGMSVGEASFAARELLKRPG